MAMRVSPQVDYMLRQAAQAPGGCASYGPSYDGALEILLMVAREAESAGLLDQVDEHRSARDGRLDRLVVQIGDAGRAHLQNTG